MIENRMASWSKTRFYAVLMCAVFRELNNQLKKCLRKMSRYRNWNSDSPIKGKGFAGVNIDFEYVYLENKEKFSMPFIGKNGGSFTSRKIYGICAVPPEVSNEQL